MFRLPPPLVRVISIHSSEWAVKPFTVFLCVQAKAQQNQTEYTTLLPGVLFGG